MKKKGETKASSHKASLAKLANKRTNRLAKQGKLHKADKKKKKKRTQQEEVNRKNYQLQKQQLEARDSREEEEGSDFSDENTDYFSHLPSAHSFIKTDLNAEPKLRNKRKRVDDEEEEYEQQPRKFAADESTWNMRMMLPIIAGGKVIKRMMEKADEEETEDADVQNPPSAKEDATKISNQDDMSTPADSRNEEDEKALLASLTPVQLFAYRKQKLTEKKQKIASLSNSVLEDPQNGMKKLKELRLMLGEMDPGVSLTVRKFATVSLMEVFKDIVPGYRLRIPTEKERAQRVKKETKSLWDYEASFLLSYKVYLEYLETMAKRLPIPEKSFLTKHGIFDLRMPQKSRNELGKLALKCLCEMLVNHPHFNYRNNIIAVIVPFTNHKNDQFSEIACEALKQVFKQDKSGDVTLEIVRTIGRMVKKRNFDVRPEVLETFLVLKIKDVDLSFNGEKTEKMKRKEKMRTLSRRERKHLKQKEHLEKELLETKATADKQQKLKLHTEIIQAVFETYIRVIRLASDSVLLPPVLEGLARFAHLINVEYFDSLFDAFNSLIESGMLTNKELLHCMQTAFTILSGQGLVINIDPATFYKHFYCTLLTVHAAATSETIPIVLECLDKMISKRRRQLSQQRVLAFIKRLCTLCLQQTSEAVMALLAAVRQFVHTYKYSVTLFDSDVQGSGVYLPLLEDPEHCCANSTSLWELHLLKHHYDPSVQAYTKHLIRMAPLAGEHQLPQELARKSPKEVYAQCSTQNIFSDKLPGKCPKKKKMKTTDFSDTEFGDFVQSVLESAPTVTVSTKLSDSVSIAVS